MLDIKHMYEYTDVLQQMLVTYMYVVIKMNMVPFRRLRIIYGADRIFGA